MTTLAGRRITARAWPHGAGGVDAVESLQSARVPRWLPVSAALLPTVLISAWLVADAVQPPSYSPVRQTVSVLSGHAGTDRWIVTAALYIVGISYVVTAAGFAALPTAPRVAMVIAGSAAIGVASFPEPAQGTSRAHAVCTGIGAITIAAWPALVARHDALLRAVGPGRSVVAMLVSAALFFWTVIETRDGTALGLAERVSSAAQSTWPLVVVLAVRRAQRSTKPGQSPALAPTAALDRQHDH